MPIESAPLNEGHGALHRSGCRTPVGPACARRQRNLTIKIFSPHYRVHGPPAKPCKVPPRTAAIRVTIESLPASPILGLADATHSRRTARRHVLFVRELGDEQSHVSGRAV